MSFWWLILAVLLLLWWAHSHKLKKKIRAQADEIKKTQAEHGHLESVLARRGKRLDVLFSAVNEVVLRVDYLGRILSANDHAREMFSMNEPSEMPQSMVVYFRDPDWQQEFLAALKRLPEASKLSNMEINGRILAPKLAPLGKEQALLLCVDMTETLAMEARRKALFSNLMHDLKTPLTSMLGYARSIEAFDDEPELRREAASVIAESSKRVSHLLDELLTLDQVAHVESQDVGSSDVLSVCQHVVESVQQQMQLKSLSVDWDFPEDLKSVAIREDELIRMVGNILDNAVCYSPEKGVIRMIASMTHGVCHLNISDQGEGVLEANLPKLTERFFRVDQVRSQTHGHGLGLAIVKELLEVRGGNIHIFNTDPHGLTVRLEIPVVSLNIKSVI
ncbi:MAG: HAMP domain-containing sensor histidine kinase [Mariprofundaceae bacterium]